MKGRVRGCGCFEQKGLVCDTQIDILSNEPKWLKNCKFMGIENYILYMPEADKMSRTGIYHSVRIKSLSLQKAVPNFLFILIPTLYCQQGLTGLKCSSSRAHSALPLLRTHDDTSVGWTSCCWCPVFLRPQLGVFPAAGGGEGQRASAAFKAPKERAKRGLRTRPPARWHHTHTHSGPLSLRFLRHLLHAARHEGSDLGE